MFVSEGPNQYQKANILFVANGTGHHHFFNNSFYIDCEISYYKFIQTTVDDPDVE